MKKVSIIGAAGTLGSSCAMTISLTSEVNELCLIDVNERMLDNHVMDLENAFPAKNIYRGSYEDLKDSNIVIVVAGVPNRNEVTSRLAYLSDNLNIIDTIGEKIAKFSPNAIILTATNPVDILNYYFYKKFGFKRNHLIGYSLNDSYRFEWALRKFLKISNDNRLECFVIGEHGESQVPVFSNVRENNKKINFTNQQKEQIMETLQSWFVRYNRLNIHRTTGWTTGVGISKFVANLLKKEEYMTVGSVILNGEYGVKDVSIGVPIMINNEGMKRVVEWTLEEEERKKFIESATKIKNIIATNV